MKETILVIKLLVYILRPSNEIDNLFISVIYYIFKIKVLFKCKQCKYFSLYSLTFVLFGKNCPDLVLLLDI